MPYPSAMLNGNGATQEELFNSDGTLNRNHYLNNDGWYYIRTGFTGKTSEYSYKSYEYIENAIEEGDFDYLTHNGERVRVGDSFEMINLNNPGQYYVDIKSYTNSDDLNYYIRSFFSYKTLFLCYFFVICFHLLKIIFITLEIILTKV